MAFYDKPKIYGDIVKRFQRFANGKQAIVYCTAITQSAKLCRKFISKGIYSMYIDVKTPQNEHNAIIEQFRQSNTKKL